MSMAETVIRDVNLDFLKMQNRPKKTKSKPIVYRTWKPPKTPYHPPSPLEIDLQRKFPANDKFLQEKTVILKRWKIKSHLGNFGSHVYEAYDLKLNTKVAIKAHISEKTTLDKERFLLSKLEHLKCVPQLICCHLNPDSRPNLRFLVMTLHGPNLETLLKRCRKFSLRTIILIGMQMLQAIEYLHCFGYIHRDIKPANFVVSLIPNDRRVVLVDFSTCKSFLTKDRRHCVPRKRPGFKGSLQYASPHAHDGEELSRRDDLWSLLFSLLSYRTELPWKREVDHGTLKHLKLNKTDQLMRRHLASPFFAFKLHVASLQYYDEPDYDLLKMSFYKTIRIRRMSRDVPYDWEKAKNPQIKTLEAIAR